MTARNWAVKLVRGLALASLTMLLGVAAASAQTIFVPPNDPTGMVFTTNSNDGWAASRGIVFQVGTTTTVSSIGLWQNLTAMTVNYEIDQTTGVSGNVGAGKTILRSGSGTFTTAGLQFIVFSIAPITLTAGNFYQIRFDFAGLSNQNFFYNNGNVSFSQAGFNLIDGTQADDASNSVMPRIEIQASIPAPIPALSPTALALLALLVLGASIALLPRRR
jgi:hypothetical protein